MFDIIKNIWKLFNIKKENIRLESLYEIKLIRSDSWNKNNHDNNDIDGKYIGRFYFNEKIDIGDIKLDNPSKSNFEDREIFNYLESKSVGYITYRLLTGQIGLFFINKEFQNKGLGKQILLRVIDDMKKEGRNSIFAITIDEHHFWSNVFNKSFVLMERPDRSVTGSGYFLDLSKN